MRAAGTMGALLLWVATLRADAGRELVPPESHGPDWAARVWQTDEGLPDNTVYGLGQSADGYLWVATHGGLARFDGVRFQEFSLTHLSGVPNRVVRALYLDRGGRLWLGMDRGPVVCVEGGTVRVYGAQEGLPDLRIEGFAEESDGTVWILYANGELARIRGPQIRRYPTAAGTPGGRVGLSSDREGRLWFARGRQWGLVRDGRFEVRHEGDEPIACLAAARAGGLWLATATRLLWSDGTNTVREVLRWPDSSRPVQPRLLWEDQTGGVWVGTAAHGLGRFEGGRFGWVPTSHREILCLAEDREGNLWAGTGGGGLNRLRPRRIELWSTAQGLPFESVRTVCEDTNGRLWITTMNGQLAREGSTGWEDWTARADWPGGAAVCVAAHPSGGVWVGTRERGLYRWNGSWIRLLGRREGLADLSIRSLCVVGPEEVWIAAATRPVIQRWKEGKCLTFELPAGTRSIRAMTVDAAGDVWVGTADGLLLRVTGDTLRNETVLVDGRTPSIRALHATPDGAVWVGYAGYGLGRWWSGRWMRLTSAQGLGEDYISQIVADGEGRLWFGGNRGVFQATLADLNAAAHGTGYVHSISYGRGEGLPALPATYDSAPGAVRRRDGRLVIPTRLGLAVIHPGALASEAGPPPVVVERVAVDDQTVALYDSRFPLWNHPGPVPPDLRDGRWEGRLPPGHRKVEFEFTALTYAAPENVHFRYRMDGFDEAWVEAGARRVASYPRLPPGRYRFRVMAGTAAGVWNEAGAGVSFAVQPFLWQTWWFRLSAGAAFTLGVVAVVRWVSFRRLRHRLRLLEQQAALQRERARIAKDIHDDVGACLTQIALLCDLAQQGTGACSAAPGPWEKIAATARQAVKSLDEIVWAVNPRNDTLAQMIDYAGQFALDYLRLAGIRCRLDLPEPTPDQPMPSDVRHNCFLVVKEALHNIVKHAGATEVWLRARVEDGGLRMEIEDNGTGFDAAARVPGADGLRNMRQRMADVGGKCVIESRPGSGTRVRLFVPWQRNGV
ncbi:MAG: two-component regulator propeller domain-containing protein [Limisphaera sp.]